MRKKHICIFTNTFYPEIGAASGRIFDLTKELVQSGFDVEVFTGMPFYPRQQVQDAYQGIFFKKEIIEGVTVNRFWVYPSHSKNPLKRFLTMFSLLGSMLLSGKLFRVVKTDLVWVQYPPVPLPLLAFVFAFFKQAKFILNVSDLWPQSIVDLGFLKAHSFGFRVLKSIEQFLYQRADLIVTQSSDLKTYIERTNQEVHLVRTGVVVERFEQKLTFSGTRPIKMIYCGIIGLAHGLADFIKEVGTKECFEDFELDIYGDGAGKEAIVTLLAQYPILANRVRLKSMVTLEEVPSLMKQYDLALVAQKTVLKGTVPAKLYEAMAIGIPVFGIIGGEAKELIDQARAGWTVAPQDWIAMRDQLTVIKGLSVVVFEQKGKNGRAAVEKLYNREELNRRFVEVVRTIC